MKTLLFHKREVSTLLDSLCGQCAQSTILDLEKRVTLALSLKRGYQYICSHCTQIFTLPLYRATVGVGTEDLLEDVIVPKSTPTIGNNIKETTEPEAGNVEQLDLFLL